MTATGLTAAGAAAARAGPLRAISSIEHRSNASSKTSRQLSNKPGSISQQRTWVTERPRAYQMMGHGQLGWPPEQAAHACPCLPVYSLRQLSVVCASLRASKLGWLLVWDGWIGYEASSKYTSGTTSDAPVGRKQVVA